MNLLLQLRMVCDQYVPGSMRFSFGVGRPRFSPYMLQDAEPSPYTIGEHLVASSSKLIVIDKILKDILPKGERVLIFSVCAGSLVVFHT